MFKRGEKPHKNLFLDDENNSFESNELPEPESVDVIPIYSGYEIPSLSFSDHLFPLFLSLSISAVSTSAFCNLKQSSD